MEPDSRASECSEACAADSTCDSEGWTPARQTRARVPASAQPDSPSSSQNPLMASPPSPRNAPSTPPSTIALASTPSPPPPPNKNSLSQSPETPEWLTATGNTTTPPSDASSRSSAEPTPAVSVGSQTVELAGAQLPDEAPIGSERAPASPLSPGRSPVHVSVQADPGSELPDDVDAASLSDLTTDGEGTAPRSGLTNDGDNSCFLNVCVQALCNVEAFRAHIQAAQPATHDGCVTEAAADQRTMQAMKEVCAAVARGERASGRALQAALAELHGSCIALGERHDALETYAHLVEALHRAVTSATYGAGCTLHGQKAASASWVKELLAARLHSTGAEQWSQLITAKNVQEATRREKDAKDWRAASPNKRNKGILAAAAVADAAADQSSPASSPLLLQALDVDMTLERAPPVLAFELNWWPERTKEEVVDVVDGILPSSALLTLDEKPAEEGARSPTRTVEYALSSMVCIARDCEHYVVFVRYSARASIATFPLTLPLAPPAAARRAVHTTPEAACHL